MFLATTGLIEHWDTSDTILCLGAWCLRYDRREQWGNLKLSVLPYPLEQPAQLIAAERYGDQIYEAALAALSECLNSMHGTAHGRRYWRILLGPWLSHYIGIVYERYLCLRSALAATPGLFTIARSRNTYQIGADLLGVLGSIHDDAFNWQLYSQLGQGMGIPTRFCRSPLMAAAPPSSGSSRWFQAATRRLAGSYLGGKRLWYSKRHLPRRSHLGLLAQTRGRAVPVPFGRFLGGLPPTEPDWNMRSALGAVAGIGSDEFSRLLVGTLPENFPLAYLEGYAGLKRGLRFILRHSPRAILAENNELHSGFLLVAAEMQERHRTKLISVQHGGSYGAALLSPMERHDQRSADAYWSWGWREGIAGPTLPMPALMPGGGFLRRRGRRPSALLYCGNSNPRYHHRFWSNPIGPQWAQVIEWRHRWIAALHATARARLQVRLYAAGSEYLWGERERLLEQFPDLHLQPATLPFRTALRRCALFVADTNHTTFLEAIAANVPSVIFWDARLNLLRPTATPYFDRLREAGVLADSPELAAATVNEIFEDPQAWWRTASVAEAVGEFREHFVRREPRQAARWRGALARLASEPDSASDAVPNPPQPLPRSAPGA